MSLKRFFVLSLLIHAAAVSVLFMTLYPKTPGNEAPIGALILTPEEAAAPRIVAPPPISGRDIPARQLINPAIPPALPGIEAPKQPSFPPSQDRGGLDRQPGGLQPGPLTGAGRPDDRPSSMPPISPKRPGLDQERLFDLDVTDRIARRDPDVRDRERLKDDAITFDTTEYRYAGYMRMLKDKLETSGCWRYPYEAASSGIYGDLLVRFVIRKNGTLAGVELVRTSGHRVLDNAALDAVSACSPFWPLPDEWKRDNYTVLGHFVYTMYGYHVR